MAIVATRVEAVQKLYVAYFGRPADTAGLDYWTNVVEANNGETAAVSATFAKEAEYTDLFKGMNNGQIIDKIYSNMFGHAADTAGRAYWVKLLDEKKVTVDFIVAEVANGALTTDKEAVENKVVAATAFTNALDTAEEQAGYTGNAALNLAKGFLAGVTNDATLATAIATPALNATVSAVVIAGTPFSVNGALARLEVAQKAEAAFLVTADGDNNAATSATKVSLDAAVVNKAGAVSGALPVASKATYDAATSAVVKAAIVADAQTTNAATLATQQAAVVAANAEVAKVAGLQAAVATLTGATTAQTAALNVQKAAAADLAGKLAFYNLNNTTPVTVGTDGAVTGVIVANPTTGKLSLAANVTETTNPGVTALLASSTALETADKALGTATAAVTTAQQSVDFLDRDAGGLEVAALGVLKAAMPGITFAPGALPTEAQIAEQLAIFDAAQKADATKKPAYDDFVAAIATYRDVADNANPLATSLKNATDAVAATNKSIKTLGDAVAALKTAEANVAQYDTLHASVTNATKVFTDNGYAIQNIDTAFEIGSAASDIFMVGKTASTISLFGLQGNDSLYVGSGYTLNTGAISTGNNAALEAFVSQVGADTLIRVETSVFGSSVATPELVNITLVGVNAADIQLNNGIITVGTPVA